MSDNSQLFIQDLNYVAFREVCDAFTSYCMPERLIKELYLRGDDSCMERLFWVMIDSQTYDGEYFARYTWSEVLAQYISLEAFRQRLRTAAMRASSSNRHESVREHQIEAVIPQRRIVVLPYHRHRPTPRRECGFTTAAQMFREAKADSEQPDLELERYLDDAQAFLASPDLPIRTSAPTDEPTSLAATAAGSEEQIAGTHDAYPDADGSRRRMDSD